MGKVVVITNLTVDGVMQAPGRSDEDTRGGFRHGGWAVPFGAMMEAGEAFANLGAFLFGRRTYEDFYAVWPNRSDNPFTEVLTNVPKYVASSTLKEPLPWRNSALLAGDAMQAISRLKAEQEKDLVVFGSGVLVQSLMEANLVDDYVLLVHPMILGSGRRLFQDGGPFAALTLRQARTTDKGVVIAVYSPGNP
jgi:dihydrofolate reductase